MKKIQLISANEWRKGHPMEIGVQPSDIYYARLCTELLQVIDRVCDRCDVPDEGRREFALLVGHYVEDVVSGTHVFDSFRRLHEKMYGRKLPFYEIGEDYFDDEVNLLDIKFFVWNHCQQLRGDEAILNPDNKFIDVIAEELFPLVCKAFEEAPEVDALHDFVFDKARYTSFVQSKKVLQWLLMSNPITKPGDLIENIKDEMESHLSQEASTDPGMLLYGIWSQHLFLTPCNFLALRAHEWLAEMLRTEGMDDEAEKMAACRHTRMKEFEIKAVAEGIATLEDCDTGEAYRLLASSVGGNVDIADQRFVHCGLATLDGKTWETNGIVMFLSKLPEKEQYTTDGKLAYDYYMKKLGGRRIAYYKSLEDMRKHLYENIPKGTDSNVSHDFDDADGVVAFVNSDGSLNLSPLAASIPDPANPYFKAIDKQAMISAIISDSVISSEMAQYFHQQGWLDSLALTSSHSPKRGRELLQGNLDFLMRYFRGAEYKQIENVL